MGKKRKQSENRAVNLIITSKDPVAQRRLEIVMELAGIPEDRRTIARVLTTENKVLLDANVKPLEHSQAYAYIEAADELILRAAREKNREHLIAQSRQRKVVRLRRALKAEDFKAAGEADMQLDERDGLSSTLKPEGGGVHKIIIETAIVNGNPENKN